jgi:AcrR family transcriptional regulator
VDAAIPASSMSSSRDKLLDTAEALFARRGFGGVGLREVARLSGLSKSALFHHFPTKVDLYGAVLERILGEALESVRSAERATGSAMKRLVAFAESLIDALAGAPTRAPLLLRTVFEPELLGGSPVAEADALVAEILESISTVLAEGMETGELRPLAIPHAITSLVGMVVFHLASGTFGDDLLGRPVYSAEELRRHKEHVVAMIENGFGALSAA